MKKIFLIIQREYLSRVKKKSFILMTILGPVLFGLMVILPLILAKTEEEEYLIAVIMTDEHGKTLPNMEDFVSKALPNTKYIKFEYLPNVDLKSFLKALPYSKYFAILHIPYNVINSQIVELYSKKQPGLSVEMHITKSMEQFLFKEKLRAKNISPDVFYSADTKIFLKTIKIEKSGKYYETEVRELKRLIGYIGGFLIYFFIFFFSSQVMRGVIEEKLNRVVEIVISSVKPFQLMIGKIIGIGMVGLTQFLIWIILLFVIMFGLQKYVAYNENIYMTQYQSQSIIGYSKNSSVIDQQNNHSEIVSSNIKLETAKVLLESFQKIDFTFIVIMFLFYFVAGYILYASMFASIGAAVSSETDTQQFLFPVTIPLIFSLIIMGYAFSNPEGNLSVIFSIVPFTSPVVMMARIGWSIPVSQLFFSVILLIITFIFTIWLAGKIYRIGILMYGKRPTYSDLIKWLKV